MDGENNNGTPIKIHDLGFFPYFLECHPYRPGALLSGVQLWKTSPVDVFFSHYPLEGAEIYLLILYIYMKADEVSSGENLTGKTETLGGAMHHVVNC